MHELATKANDPTSRAVLAKLVNANRTQILQAKEMINKNALDIQRLINLMQDVESNRDYSADPIKKRFELDEVASTLKEKRTHTEAKTRNIVRQGVVDNPKDANYDDESDEENKAIIMEVTQSRQCSLHTESLTILNSLTKLFHSLCDL